ncbi:MAG TPA: TROVE domain-containing protein [Cytophagales bacterium]|nr:TROVE domain-containing protein [Cytophagales bacterium]
MRFNVRTQNKPALRNHEGERAYAMTPEMELYTAVVTASLSGKFYETDAERHQRTVHLIGKVSPQFVAKLAIYTREKMYLRSIPVVLAVELAKIHRGDSLVKETVTRIIQRADEITEVLAYYQWTNRREGTKKLNGLSKQVQKGVAAAFGKFDEYQFGKYNRKAEVTLRDALFLTHPKGQSQTQQALYNKIATESLETPYTWEVELSVLGQQGFIGEQTRAKAMAEKWEELIDSGRLGYMALLRNLRNLLEVHVSKQHILKVADALGNPEQVRRSKQLPFRFVSAYREVQATGVRHAFILMEALETAVLASAANIKGFDRATRVVLASDVSGSMVKPISPRSTVMAYDVGLVLSMLLRNRCKNVVTGLFGDTWKRMEMPKGNILANVEQLRRRSGEVGYATNGYLVIRDLYERREAVDKVMIFTDCQLWNSRYASDAHIQQEWLRYLREVAPNAQLYLFDLAGYGQSPLQRNQHGVAFIAGWSDKVFEVLEALENGAEALEHIAQVQL